MSWGADDDRAADGTAVRRSRLMGNERDQLCAELDLKDSQLKTTTEKLRQQLLSTERQYLESQYAAADLRARLAKLETELKCKDGELSELRGVHGRLTLTTSELQAMRGEVLRLRHQASGGVEADLRKSLETKDAELSIVRAEVQGLKKELASRPLPLDPADDQVAAVLESDNRDLQKQIRRLDEEVIILRTTIDKQEAKHRREMERAVNAEGNVARHEADEQRLQEEAERLRRELARARQALARFEEAERLAVDGNRGSKYAEKLIADLTAPWRT
eukprot:TRINITY_DN37260_c0_g1_i1.p1 TRINITY_DN37260_c0_g1~~TRINITY_DN37260_c0_g1_i1.p1  ORF type:complete len:276 (-),score=88.99 TRINITY_DN37260_c0_g1_i1:230-1057(-)